MFKKTISSAIILLILFTSCSKKQDEPQTDVKDSVRKEVEGKLTLNNPWVRLAAKGMNTAMFVEIVNGTEKNDSLISVDSDVAELVEIHETYRRENDMMGMRQVEFVELPAGDTVMLKPMSLHVMFIGLRKDLAIGDSVEATMNFKFHTPISVTGIVKEMNMKPPVKAE